MKWSFKSSLLPALSYLALVHAQLGDPMRTDIALGKYRHLDDFHQFKTEPTFWASKIDVVYNVEDESLLQPGYIFFSPFPRPRQRELGPQIIDQKGNLVWYGNHSTTGRVQDFHACRYLGEEQDHLCWSESDWKTIQGVRGWNRVLDNTYTPVGHDYRSTGDLRFPNPHEFNILPGGKTFLQAVYQLKQVDLTPYAGSEHGFVEDGCFQEVDVLTGHQLFAWCGLDYLELWHSKIFLFIDANVANHTGEDYGTGAFDAPWDYFHLNAVDKTEGGDYILSARHLDCLIKVAGNDNPNAEPGTILWRLGGKFNDFKGAWKIDLSRQHHIRIVAQEGKRTTLSIFNNQWQAHGEDTRHMSNGQIFVIDEDIMFVESTKKYYQPEARLSFAQGAMSVLPNGNAFIGWGTVPHVTEFSPEGEVLYHIHLSKHFESEDPWDRDEQNYRSFKFDWVGKPLYDPKLVAYTQSCDQSDGNTAPLIAYVSWNGATEVRYWRFHTSRWFNYGPWIPAGTFDKEGFETQARLKDIWGGAASFQRFVSVEALDSNKNVIGKAVTKTFVPNDEVEEACDEEGCNEPSFFVYDESLSSAETCGPGVASPKHGYLLVVVVVIAIAGLLLCFRFHRQRTRPKIHEVKYRYLPLYHEEK